MKQVVRLKDKNGELLEFSFCPCSDSFYHYPKDDVEIVVIRRPGKLFKGHIYKKYLDKGKLVYEGDVIYAI